MFKSTGYTALWGQNIGDDSVKPTRTQERKHAETRPRRLGDWTVAKWFELLLNLFLALIPLFFIVLVAITASLHHKPLSELGSNVQRILLVLPSLFPIIFAALVGKFFKILAIYKAERGVSLGILERLVGCQSLFTAIERNVQLHRWDILGIAVIAIWALSPIGGQAGLRMIGTQPATIRFTDNLYFLPMYAGQLTSFQESASIYDGAASFTPIFLTSLLSARLRQDSPTDLWGNVKIPNINVLADKTSSNLSEWRAIESDNTSWSSLLGIPLAGSPANGNMTGNIVSANYNVSCSSSSWLKAQNISGLGSARTFTASTEQVSLFDIFEQGQPFTFQSMTSATAISSYPAGQSLPDVSQFQCVIGAQWLESVVFCQDRTCRVSSMRALPKYPPPEFTMNGDGFSGLMAVCVMNIFNALPISSAGGETDNGAAGSTNVEKWIFDPSTDFNRDFSYVNLTNVPPEVFGLRLESVINALWQASYSVPWIEGDLDSNETLYKNFPLTEGGVYPFNSTLAQVSQRIEDEYVCHWGWLLPFLIISILLFVTSLCLVILKSRVVAPDIFGYASSLTRDSLYAMVSEKGSHLSGSEWAREFQNVHVMLGDCKGDADIGHVAFVAADTDHVTQRLQKGRLYD